MGTQKNRLNETDLLRTQNIIVLSYNDEVFTYVFCLSYLIIIIVMANDSILFYSILF